MNILHRVTLENLKKNKVRTFVTIIGIILSVSLFTAVTSSVYSLQTYILEVVKEQEGHYHGGVYEASAKDLEKVVPHEKVKNTVMLQNLGYAKVEGSGTSISPISMWGPWAKDFLKPCLCI